VSGKHRRLVRVKEALARLAVGKSKFYEKFVKPGRVHLIPIGPRHQALDEEELDTVIAEVIAEGKALARAGLTLPPRNAASGQFVKKASSRKSTKELRP
jgi:hypothetical protein